MDNLGPGRSSVLPRWYYFLGDETAQSLRRCVIAVAAGALTAVVVGTLLAERIYVGFIDTFSP